MLHLVLPLHGLRIQIHQGPVSQNCCNCRIAELRRNWHCHHAILQLSVSQNCCSCRIAELRLQQLQLQNGKIAGLQFQKSGTNPQFCNSCEKNLAPQIVVRKKVAILQFSRKDKINIELMKNKADY